MNYKQSIHVLFKSYTLLELQVIMVMMTIIIIIIITGNNGLQKIKGNGNISAFPDIYT